MSLASEKREAARYVREEMGWEDAEKVGTTFPWTDDTALHIFRVGDGGNLLGVITDPAFGQVNGELDESEFPQEVFDALED